MDAAVGTELSEARSALFANLQSDLSQLVQAQIDKVHASAKKGPHWDLIKDASISSYLFDASHYPIYKAVDEGIELQSASSKAMAQPGLQINPEKLEKYARERVSNVAATYVTFISDPLQSNAKRGINGLYESADKTPLILDALNKTDLANALNTPVALILLQKAYASLVVPMYGKQ